MIIDRKKGDFENNICRPQTFNKKILLESTLKVNNTNNVPLTTRDGERHRLYSSLLALYLTTLAITQNI
jgi:hypothetical protein